MLKTDVLIIGSGLAGQSAALRLAALGRRVILVSKRKLSDCSSNYAQGGIAAVLDSADSIAAHIKDTLDAGANLNDQQICANIISNGKDAINWLIAEGVPFNKNSQGFQLALEGGHSHRRVIHVNDNTGNVIQQVLSEKLLQHPLITVLENHLAVDLIVAAKINPSSENDNRCLGAYILDNKKQKVDTIAAGHVILATGGVGKVYLYTTNPDTSTGDGIAMAWRAGCRVSNMEFIQFHPTCLYHPAAKSFLISEAVRGEGAVLRLPDGKRFMFEHDARGELAPRDIVARAIDYEMKKSGLDCVYLDITAREKEFIYEHFPTIYNYCLKLGIDMSKDWIPVVPAVHFTCGGVQTDWHARTDLSGLYAVGEVAHSGLHGANRLASNSLLECLVMAKQAVIDIMQQQGNIVDKLPDWDESRVSNADEEVVISHNWEELRRFMWDYVGIVRTNKRLQRAMHRIRLLNREITEYYANFRISHDLIELRNLVLVAELIVKSALKRKESRGLHYSLDYPQLASKIQSTILSPRKKTSKQ